MNESAKNSDGLAVMGWFVRLVGWAICVGSIFFALENKSADPPYFVQCRACLAILVVVSAAYLVARRVSERWQSKAFRSYFSPYIVGATIWLVLFVAFFILDRLVNR
jgi:hypothetical protein